MICPDRQQCSEHKSAMSGHVTFVHKHFDRVEAINDMSGHITCVHWYICYINGHDFFLHCDYHTMYFFFIKVWETGYNIVNND